MKAIDFAWKKKIGSEIRSRPMVSQFPLFSRSVEMLLLNLFSLYLFILVFWDFLPIFFLPVLFRLP